MWLWLVGSRIARTALLSRVHAVFEGFSRATHGVNVRLARLSSTCVGCLLVGSRIAYNSACLSRVPGYFQARAFARCLFEPHCAFRAVFCNPLWALQAIFALFALQSAVCFFKAGQFGQWKYPAGYMQCFRVQQGHAWRKMLPGWAEHHLF